MKFCVWIIFVLVLFACSSCSYVGSLFDSVASDAVSDSSRSSSNSIARASRSISHSFASVSNSSSDEEEEDAEKDTYRKEVREYTVVFMESEAQTSFKRDISQIAKDHGITNWEQNKHTYLGIGEGLKQAGISAGDMMTFKHRFAGSPWALKYLMQGYESYSS